MGHNARFTRWGQGSSSAGMVNSSQAQSEAGTRYSALSGGWGMPLSQPHDSRKSASSASARYKTLQKCSVHSMKYKTMILLILQLF